MYIKTLRKCNGNGLVNDQWLMWYNRTLYFPEPLAVQRIKFEIPIIISTLYICMHRTQKIICYFKACLTFVDACDINAASPCAKVKALCAVLKPIYITLRLNNNNIHSWVYVLYKCILSTYELIPWLLCIAILVHAYCICTKIDQELGLSKNGWTLVVNRKQDNRGFFFSISWRTSIQ